MPFRFCEMLIANPGTEVDISFQPNRITFERMHIGAQTVNDKRYLLNSLFPIKSECSVQRRSLTDQE